jgi:hypothetical protein
MFDMLQMQPLTDAIIGADFGDKVREDIAAILVAMKEQAELDIEEA